MKRAARVTRDCLLSRALRAWPLTLSPNWRAFSQATVDTTLDVGLVKSMAIDHRSACRAFCCNIMRNFAHARRGGSAGSWIWCIIAIVPGLCKVHIRWKVRNNSFWFKKCHNLLWDVCKDFTSLAKEKDVNKLKKFYKCWFGRHSYIRAQPVTYLGEKNEKTWKKSKMTFFRAQLFEGRLALTRG